MKSFLKRILPESVRRRARQLGRLRFITKLRVARRYHVPPARAAVYVLTDPEVDSFSYRIGNTGELAEVLADVLGRPAETMARYLDEARADKLLRESLTQPLHHLLWAKRHPHPKGYHEACWAVIRATKPALAVETGILDGLGSTVMLCALERNAQEGAEGELLSFDIMPGAGQMVPEALRGRWTTTWEDAATAIDRVVGERSVGFLASDSLQDPAQINRELAAVERHRDREMIAMTAWGRERLEWPSDQTKLFKERPAGHFYGGITFAVRNVKPTPS